MARPSKYDPKLIDEMEAMAQEGASVLECATRMGVCKQTLFNWAEEHPEFLDALTRAKALRQVWWERVHRKCASTGEGNAASIQFGLKNIAPDDYRDKVEQELSGPGGGPIPTEVRRTIVDPTDRDA